ncbi:glycosyltransferase, partial [Streptomyces sp. NPDC002346]
MSVPGPTALLVIAKEPLPGLVKTRLTPPFTPAEAAQLAEAALRDTLRTIRELWDTWTPDGTPRPFRHHGQHFTIEG